jgi:hypothetical protein
MADPLYDAIARAIQEPLDGDLFEQCAAVLLHEYYPTLRPAEGGNDAGMDGVGELPNGERFYRHPRLQRQQQLLGALGLEHVKVVFEEPPKT